MRSMRLTRPTITAAFAALLLFGSERASLAEDSKDVVEARADFVRGAAFIRELQYADALTAFEKSAKLRPHAAARPGRTAAGSDVHDDHRSRLARDHVRSQGIRRRGREQTVRAGLVDEARAPARSPPGDARVLVEHRRSGRGRRRRRRRD